jgi:hypothetical protein
LALKLNFVKASKKGGNQVDGKKNALQILVHQFSRVSFWVYDVHIPFTCTIDRRIGEHLASSRSSRFWENLVLGPGATQVRVPVNITAENIPSHLKVIILGAGFGTLTEIPSVTDGTTQNSCLAQRQQRLSKQMADLLQIY